MLRYIKDTMLHYIKLTPGIRRQSGGLLRALLTGGGGSSPPRRPGPQMPINYTTACPTARFVQDFVLFTRHVNTTETSEHISSNPTRDAGPANAAEL